MILPSLKESLESGMNVLSDVLGFILWREEVGEGEIIKAGFP